MYFLIRNYFSSLHRQNNCYTLILQDFYFYGGKHYCLELSTEHDLWLEHATKKMFWIGHEFWTGHEVKWQESCIMVYIWKVLVSTSHLTITTI